MSEEMREVFGKTLVELGHEFAELVVLDADLHTSSKAVYFKQAFPGRFIQCGIAEQNMFGIAAGLATQGFIPFPCTFAVFASQRALDQIAVSIAYPRLSVKIPGSYVGIPTSRAGASHNAVADLAIMRSLPHMRVADPGDNRELRSLMRAAVLTEGPVYFRITRYTLPDLFGTGYEFAWGRGVRLREGRDVTLIGTGMMTGLCLEAAELLARDGVSAEVLHCGSIKPLDEDLVAESARKTGAVVTAENASVVGGLGSAVAEVLTERAPAVLRRVGVQDRFIESGGIGELLAHHRMRPADIAGRAREALEAKERLP
ncbi:MAG: transketolase family protein [Anaerolineae bacterium]|nr:transketolase family protein [Anaerolineae bacterium]